MKVEFSEQEAAGIETLLRLGLQNALAGQQANEAVEVYNAWRKAVTEAKEAAEKKPGAQRKT